MEFLNAIQYLDDGIKNTLDDCIVFAEGRASYSDINKKFTLATNNDIVEITKNSWIVKDWDCNFFVLIDNEFKNRITVPQIKTSGNIGRASMLFKIKNEVSKIKAGDLQVGDLFIGNLYIDEPKAKYERVLLMRIDAFSRSDKISAIPIAVYEGLNQNIIGKIVTRPENMDVIKVELTSQLEVQYSKR